VCTGSIHAASCSRLDIGALYALRDMGCSSIANIHTVPFLIHRFRLMLFVPWLEIKAYWAIKPSIFRTFPSVHLFFWASEARKDIYRLSKGGCLICQKTRPYAIITTSKMRCDRCGQRCDGGSGGAISIKCRIEPNFAATNGMYARGRASAKATRATN